MENELFRKEALKHLRQNHKKIESTFGFLNNNIKLNYLIIGATLILLGIQLFIPIQMKIKWKGIFSSDKNVIVFITEESKDKTFENENIEYRANYFFNEDYESVSDLVLIDSITVSSNLTHVYLSEIENKDKIDWTSADGHLEISYKCSLASYFLQ